MLRMVQLALVLGLVSMTLGGVARAADPLTLEQTLAASASTPAQHQALAAFYAGKAEESKKEAANHRAMGLAYSGRKDMANMREHCDKLASLQDDIAKQYAALAEMEQAAAK